MDFESLRYRMIQLQVRTWGVLDQGVLDALTSVPRECFTPEAQRNLAFVDGRLPIGKGLTMLEPKLEARVLQAVALKSSDSVLEIGAGSGHMAALLAFRAERVRSIEIDPELAALARSNLQKAGIENAIVEDGDGAAGWPARAPFDVIVLSGGIAQVPEVLFEQLKPGGRLFAFVGSDPVMQGTLYTKTDNGRIRSSVLFDTLVPELRLPIHSAFSF